MGGSLYQFNDAVSGNGGGAAALAVRPAPVPPRISSRFLTAGHAELRDLDLVVDLGNRIGSPTWLRGAVTCMALCYSAWSFAPGLDPIQGMSPRPYEEAELKEVGALAISSLSLGAETGRPVAPTAAVRPLSDPPERPSVDLSATLSNGQAFARALEGVGVGSKEAKLAQDVLAASLALSEIEGQPTIDLTLGRRPNKTVARPIDSLSFRARFDLRVEMTRADGTLRVKRVPIHVDHTPLRIQGTVGSSLYRSARAAGAPAKAIESFLRAIATQVRVGSLGANDQFDFIIERRRAETGETETGKLLYAGLDRSGGKKIQLMEWEQGGRKQWFEASGVGKESGSLQRPVPGTVSSNFGMRRHPILGYSRMHKGMDFRAGYGTPILAASDGRVARAGWAGGYGKQVRLNHSGGLSTSYSHMSRIVAKPGQQVRQGQVIGYVGSTGLSTGPHLHYEMYKNGTPVNPASVKFTTRAQLSGSELSRFRSRLAQLKSTPVVAPKAEPVEASAD